MKIEDLLNKEVIIEGKTFIYAGIVPYQLFDVRTLQHEFVSENEIRFFHSSTEFEIEESNEKITLKIK